MGRSGWKMLFVVLFAFISSAVIVFFVLLGITDIAIAKPADTGATGGVKVDPTQSAPRLTRVRIDVGTLRGQRLCNYGLDHIRPDETAPQYLSESMVEELNRIHGTTYRWYVCDNGTEESRYDCPSGWELVRAAPIWYQCQAPVSPESTAQTRSLSCIEGYRSEEGVYTYDRIGMERIYDGEGNMVGYNRTETPYYIISCHNSTYNRNRICHPNYHATRKWSTGYSTYICTDKPGFEWDLF